MDKKYINEFSNLMTEWDWEENKARNIYPNKIGFGSTKKVFWKCSKGHKWQATPNSRTGFSKTGCPYCANRKVYKGYNDLASLKPKVANRWDYSKNNNISPTSVVCGSNKKVWWICEKGHSFEAKICNVVENEKYCPICKNQKTLIGYNDLFTSNPELERSWDFSRNESTPQNFTRGSNKRVWWICEKGHTWEASVASRACKKTGCPYCSHEKAIIGENDLISANKELAMEWDYKRNTKLNPQEVLPFSNKLVWWICSKGHNYKARICDRVRGRSCPYCLGKKVLIGFNDLRTVNPELAKEWNIEKNLRSPEEITRGSSLKVWWKCKKGHEWAATVSSRSAGCGCPTCMKELQSSLPEKAIFWYIKKEFPQAKANQKFPWLGKSEIDIYIPNLNLGIEYDGAAWHKRIDKDLKKDKLCFEHDIMLIRVREEGCPTYESMANKIYAQQTNANLIGFDKTITEIFALIGKLKNIKLGGIIDLKRDYNLIVKELSIGQKKNSLLEKYPGVAKDWNYSKNNGLAPSSISWGSQKKVWWKCKEGHEWEAVVLSRTKGSCGCPICSNKTIVKGINDLLTLNQEISMEWDFEKNGKLTPENVSIGSSKKVWWKCGEGHSWQAKIYSRTGSQKSGCPLCAKKFKEKSD